jgi:hypothetical protein
MDEMQFQKQFKADGPPTLGDVFARALLPDRAELEEARAAKAAAAALAERREQLSLLNAMNGDPMGELSRAQSATAAARDVVRDLEGKLSEAREVLTRAEGNLSMWGGQVDEVMTQVARRSEAEVDLLAPARRAHQEFVTATRAAFAAAQAGTSGPARRPFGNAVRSDQPVTCPECIKCGFTAAQSFEVHHSDADGNPLAVEQVSEDAETGRYQPVRAGGRDYVYDKAHREISRAGRP